MQNCIKIILKKLFTYSKQYVEIYYLPKQCVNYVNFLMHYYTNINSIWNVLFT